jgi:hypothetical protein
MTYSQVVQPVKSETLKNLLWPGLLVVSVLAAYIPTALGLIDGPWQTEQEGHGPMIIAASLWLVWQLRERLKSTEISAAPVAGWIALLIGLALMFLARIQFLRLPECDEGRKSFCLTGLTGRPGTSGKQHRH